MAIGLVLASSGCGGRTGLGLETTKPADAGLECVPGATPRVAGGASTAIHVLFMPSAPGLCPALMLLEFYPSTATFAVVGPIDCSPEATRMVSPTTFFVNRSGVATMSFDRFYHVSIGSGACEPAASLPTQRWSWVWGSMAFSAKEGSNNETLYSIGRSGDGSPQQLASLDPNTFVATPITALSPAAPISQNTAQLLAGTGAGDLFTEDIADQPQTMARVDSNTGRLTPLFALGPPLAEASTFAFWGGYFYFFVSSTPQGKTAVLRVAPTDGSYREVATLPGVVSLVAAATSAPTH